ncbi:MAG: BACON domain-containing carbohydrate-binding protein [Vicinamibacterales bacterium]
MHQFCLTVPTLFRRLLPAAAAILIATLLTMVAACSKSSNTSVGPSPTKCQLSAAGPVDALDANGGTAAITISAQPECAWTATVEGSWISGLTPGTGQGDGRLEFRAAANPSATMREAVIVLNGQRVTVRQQPTACQYDITPRTRAVDARAGSGSVSVETAGGCAWSASSSAGWITISAGGTGSGAGTVSYQFAANAGEARTGQVTIAGQSFALSQVAAATPNCQFVVTPSTFDVPGGETTATADVSAGAGCGWSVISNDPWVSLVTPSQMTGSGAATFRVSANPGGGRSTTLIVAGQTVTVDQAGTCSVSIAPAAQSVGGGGGTTATAVSTPRGCSWAAVSNASWLSITSGANGSGVGSVVVAVQANTGAARSGTISVGGQTFTVNQDSAESSGCSFSLNPASQSLGTGAAAGSPIAVTAPNGCSWAASSGSTWISITSGAAGSGNGTVGFTVTVNTGPSRTGVLIIAGQTVNVTQAGGCTASINPTSQSLGASGGAGTSIAVTAPAGCAWTSTSNDAWITRTGGATGSGNGTVTFTVAANSGPSRTGTLTVAGQTFTVNQAGGCTSSVNPTSQNIGAGGGSGTGIAVTAAAGCTWSSVSNDSWITVTAGATGSGNGSVTFTVASNSGAPRTGTLTVAGQTFTVTQAGGCAYSIAPSSKTVAQGGGTGGPVAVTTAAGCTWTAVSGVSWVTITSGATGSGNGSVGFSVASNPGAPRSGTLTIAGQTFTVSQGGTCSFTVAPTTISVGPDAGAGPDVTVTATTGCTWTATSNDSWITITGGATGNGNGTVTVAVAANPAGARNGTILVAGQTVTIKQAKH